MRWRAISIVSLGINLALVGVLLISARYAVRSTVPTAVASSDTNSGVTKTNVVVRRQFFSWREVESADYPTYVANLRDIGCPEQTIRDIIIADVNALYARRRATEVLTPEQQWWRASPDTNVVAAAAAKSRALDEERRTLLAKLLGATWESGDAVSLPRPSRPGMVLDGPLLGPLPAETKQAVQQINLQAQDRLQSYLDNVAAAGKTPDPVELAKIRQQTRDELSRVLAPPQLEEYLLRYSDDANAIRTELGQLKYFDATADEFRAIFRATDPIDQQLQLLSGNDPNTVAQRNSLQQQRDNAIKLALGPERYEEYRILHDPGYRDAYALSLQAGAPQSAETVYAINQATSQEANNIRSNSALNAIQKAIELKRLELDQLKANAAATGQEVPPEPPQPPKPTPTQPHVIGVGENIETVSLRYSVPISTIRAANPDLDFNKLRPGDTIRIPDFRFVPPQ